MIVLLFVQKCLGKIFKGPEVMCTRGPVNPGMIVTCSLYIVFLWISLIIYLSSLTFVKATYCRMETEKSDKNVTYPEQQ